MIYRVTHRDDGRVDDYTALPTMFADLLACYGREAVEVDGADDGQWLMWRSDEDSHGPDRATRAVASIERIQAPPGHVYVPGAAPLYAIGFGDDGPPHAWAGSPLASRTTNPNLAGTLRSRAEAAAVAKALGGYVVRLW